MAVTRAFPHPPDLEPQERKGFICEQVNHFRFLPVHLDTQRCQDLLKALQGPCCPASFGVVSTHRDDDKCLSKNIFTYTANFQDVVRYGAMTVLGLNEAE